MKILVLGGSGFIGSQVCVKAVSEGHEVHALGRNKPNKVPEGVNWVSKDALDYEGMKSFLQKESFDAVVNCIGILFDYSTPLRRLNKLFSGSNSVALNNNETYSNIIEGISLNIYLNFSSICLLILGGGFPLILLINSLSLPCVANKLIKAEELL